MALAEQLAQGVQFAPPPDPFAQYGKMQQLQAGQTQNALAQYQLGAAQRADETNTNFLRGVQSAGGDEDAIRQAYMSAGKIKEYQDYQKSLAEAAKLREETKNFGVTRQKTQSDVDAADLTKKLKTAEIIGSVLDSVKDQPSYDQAKRVLSYIVSPDSLADYPAVYDPGFINAEKAAGQTYTQAQTAKNAARVAATGERNAATNERTATTGEGNLAVNRGQLKLAQEQPTAIIDPITQQPVYVKRTDSIGKTPAAGGALKTPPVHAQKAITGGAATLSKLDETIKSIENIDATGFKGFLPDVILNRADPTGTTARANITDIGSLILHDRSGATITASETPRLLPFIPSIRDDKATVLKKLNRMRDIQAEELDALEGTYNPDQGYRSFVVPKKAAPEAGGAPPAGIDAALWNVMTPKERALWQK